MHRRIAAASGAALLSLSACNDDVASNSTGSPSGGASGKAAEVNVFAAASPKEFFGEMEKKFESAHPDVDLVFNFAGSQELVGQIDSGVPADAVATADTTTMDALRPGGKVVGTKILALNTLILIAPKGNPVKITGLDSFLDGAKLVIYTPKASTGGKTVSCGTATAELVRKLDVKPNPVSGEQEVVDIRSKVMSGEADVGVVYRTDAVADGKEVKTIEIPGADTIVNDYPVGVVEAFKNSPKAKAFAEYITSREGQATFKKHDFNEAGTNGR